MFDANKMTLREKFVALSMMLGDDAKKMTDEAPEEILFDARAKIDTLQLLGATICDLAKTKTA
jgi:hypothetical protein